MHQLRSGYLQFGAPWPLTPPPEKLTILKNVAGCFGRNWEGIMMIALVTLHSRDLSSDNVSNFLSKLGSTQLPQLVWDAFLRTIHHGWKGMDKAKQFRQLLRLVHDRKESEMGRHSTE